MSMDFGAHQNPNPNPNPNPCPQAPASTNPNINPPTNTNPNPNPTTTTTTTNPYPNLNPQLAFAFSAHLHPNPPPNPNPHLAFTFNPSLNTSSDPNLALNPTANPAPHPDFKLNPNPDHPSAYPCPHFLNCHLCTPCPYPYSSNPSANQSYHNVDLGSSSHQSQLPVGEEGSSLFNAPSPEDSDRDGFNDVLVGSSSYGDAFWGQTARYHEFVSTGATSNWPEASSYMGDSHVTRHSNVDSAHSEVTAVSAGNRVPSPISLIDHATTPPGPSIHGPNEDGRQTIVIRVNGADLRTLSDGYFWRKYGEKNIKNKKHRRSYFRCAEAGCDVTKHAERCSEDPNVVIMTYTGKHNHAAQHL